LIFFNIQAMKRLHLPCLLLSLIIALGCKQEPLRSFPAADEQLSWQGRTWVDPSGYRMLIGSAASLKFSWHGDQCKVWIRNAGPPNEYNYISLVIDGVHHPRQAIRSGTFYPLDIIPSAKAEVHTVELYKETEAFNGAIIVSRVEAVSLVPINPSSKKRIEFIGNSITVGMSADDSQVPCDRGTWYDQHNAYDAFGPRVARMLDMDYLVTGFSGMGVYRNTSADRPVMADIYPSVVLSPDPNSPRWDFKKFVPDLVSICLGTNDFSSGDGATPRDPFDPERFVPAYVDFIRTIHGYYPAATIVLTNTPMLDEPKNKILMDCLTRIKAESEKTIPGLKPLYLFSFSKTYMSGCLGHPSVEEHGLMADEFAAFLSEMKL
jgi:hypothetical protein